MNVNPSSSENTEVNYGPKWGYRHIQCVLIFFVIFNFHTTRSNLSIALVAMTDLNSTNTGIPTYNWSNTNVILSSFHWTYIIFQIISGYIFKKLGVKWTIFASLFLNNVAFLLIPTAAHFFGSVGVIFCHAAQGLFQGFTMPLGHYGLGRWAPLSERSFLSMVVYISVIVGPLFTLVVSGYICYSEVGWPMTYYFYATLSMFCCVAWAFLSYDSPSQHPRIPFEERNYIERSLKEDAKGGENIGDIPVKPILTSLAFWAIVVANAGNSWGFTIVQNDVPTYMHNVFKYNMATIGLISASPQITQLFVTLATGPACDLIVKKKKVSLMNARRIYQLTGAIFPAFLLTWLAYISADQKMLAIVLLNVACGFNALQQYGALINHIDISPRYASVLVSIENSISTVFSIFAPLFIQYVVTDLTDITLWKYVFLTIAFITLSTSIFFSIFGSAQIQWWNFRKQELRDSTKD